MSNSEDIQQLADYCVKCGMCLPVCPTYRITRNEAESPRGRIALIQGLLSGQLQYQGKTAQYLEHCLYCGNCEQICPSDVNYLQLMDDAKACAQQTTKASRLKKIPFDLLTRPRSNGVLRLLLRLYKLSGLRFLVQHSGLLHLLKLTEPDAILDNLGKHLKLKSRYPTQAPLKAKVALFTGCLGNWFEQQTLRDSIKLLNLLGYEVHIPEQACCGALHQHNGFMDTARQYANFNIKHFLQQDYAAILFTASGCGAQLAQMDETLHPRATEFHNKLFSVSRFILQQAGLKDCSFKPLAEAVMLHTPCTLRNSLNQPDDVMVLLKFIPGIKLQPLSEQHGCCGAAGWNMISSPRMASQIRQSMLDEILVNKPTILVTSNIGCQLHLAAGLSTQKHAIKVMHPVSLLYQQVSTH